MTIHVMIPARLASTRLPGKVLLPIAGKPILQHVYERAVEAGVGKINILVDDDKVAAVAREFCEQVTMTDPACISGTARIMQVINHPEYDPNDMIISIQADEPFIEPEKIRMLVELLDSDPSLPMATLAHVIDNPEDLSNPNVVKVVLNKHGEALYFSRSLIPHSEQPQTQNYLRHLGLYAYRVGFLREIQTLPVSDLQLLEKLEQLTVLYHGYKIKVGVTSVPRFIDINTPEDYQRVSREVK